MKKSLLSILLIFCISSFVNSQTTFSWRNDQNPTSGQWNVSNYWWNGSGAALPGGSEILFLDGSVGTTMTNDLPSTNRYRITFGASGNSRTINGSTSNAFYDFSNNIPAIFNASGNTQTINFPLQIGNTSTSTSPQYGFELNASSGNLTLGTSATISAQNNTGTKVLVLRASSGGSGTVTLNGVVSNGSGTMSISKIETNTAIMGALNTYTGTTAITGGTLRANIAQSGSAGAFGNNSTITISSGCTLDLNGFNTTVASVSETGTSNGGVITLGSGNLTISGGFGGTRFQNSISGTGGLIKQGTGILSLYGTQSYSGSTTVSGGELSSAVAMSSTSYTINGGTFRMAASNIVPTSSNFDLSSGTLTYDNSQTINNLTVSGGTLNVAAGQTLTVNGTLTINGATTITLNSTGKIVYGASGKLIINTALTTTNDIWPVTLSEQPKDVTIGANVTLHAARSVSNALILTTGTFTNTNTLTMLNGSTITRTNGALSDPPSITSGNYAVIYNGSANITSGTSSTPELNPSGGSNVGSITINLSSSSFTVNTSTGAAITSAGGVTISRGTLALGNTLRLTGDWSMANTGAGFTPGTQTVNFNGSGSQAITVTGTGGGSTTFYILQMQKGGGTLSFGANTTATVTNSLFLSFGTFNNGSSLTVSGGASVSRQNGTLSAAPTYGSNVNVAFNSGTNANSGFELQPSAGSINNLSVASAIYTLAGNAVINGSVTINSGTLATSTFNINLKGAWTRAAAASFTSSGTVTFDGTSAQTITLTGGGTETFNNLTISNTNVSGVSPSTSNATSLAINGILSVSSGSILDMVTNALTGSSFTTSGTGTLRTQNTGTALPSGRTWSMAVQYNANGAQNIAGGTYSNGLTCSNTSIATKTMAADASVSGALSLSTSKLALNGNTLTLNGTVSGMDASNSLVGSNSSKLTVTSTSSVGSVFFDQTTDGNILNPTSGTNALQNLVVSGSGGSVTLGNKVNLFERLSVSAGTFNTGDSLVLRSRAGTSGNNTAYVDQVGGTINGQVRVERYIHSQNRGWRAITAPITYNNLTPGTVKENWQNSWGLGTNYGTRVTGPSATNGLDDVSISASLKTYNGSTGTWNNVTNTNTETMASTASSAANKSFFMYVRGDRTVTPNGYNPNAFQSTTLPTRGKLQTGTQTFNLVGPANNYWLIGNPYACPVDMSLVSLSNIGTSVYVWDPNLTGSDIYSSGAYTTFTTAGWVNGGGGSTTKYFQSGQAFFVQPNAGTASVTFNESNKSTGNQNNQTSGTGNGLSDIFQIKLSFVDANNIVRETDGAMAMFGSSYSAGNDSYDAIKWTTAGRENLSLSRNNKSLVIEARPYITGQDTLFLNMTTMSVGANYQFKVNPINFDASVSSCKLVDKFLNTETPISLSNATLVGFNVTSVTGSNAANRFYVVFNAAGSLPTSNSLTVKAYKQNNSVKIDWEAIAENNVKTYTVEKSTDATSFTKLSEATAKNGNTTNAYSIVDNNPVIGVNYYRIQSVQNNNNKVYSTIVRVEMSDKGIKSITVYPNPVKSNTNTIGLQMNNLASGKYTAILYNAAGQQVWMNTMNHNGNNGSTSLQLNKTLASGTYQLQLTDSKGNSYKQTVLVVE